MVKTAITIDDARSDWRILDDKLFTVPVDVRLISHEKFTGESEINVEYVEPGSIARFFSKIQVLYWFLYAVRLFRLSDGKSVVIVNGGITYLWLWCGLFNVFPIFGKRKLFCWDIFVEYILSTEKRLKFLPFIKLTIQRKEKLARLILKQYVLNVVWSKKQVETHSRHFNLPENHFIFIPFKANHSKRETYDIPMGNFIFAGGNGKRDYEILIEAVRDTNIPVIISATDPEVRKRIEPLPNVIVLGAPEPAFAQLQAASRFVVIPMQYSGLKGGGEANFCNAMWHGKPIIAVDSIAAEDYIVQGKTGFIVQSGDTHGLRQRILELWNDVPLCAAMGKCGRQHVEYNFTHTQFISRLLRLAVLEGSLANA